MYGRMFKKDIYMCIVNGHVSMSGVCIMKASQLFAGSISLSAPAAWQCVIAGL